MWLVSLDSIHCNIYQYDKYSHHFSLYKSLSHEQGRVKNHDLSVDKAGAYQRFTYSSSSFAPHSQPKEKEKMKFAKLIANEINLSKERNLFHSLIIAADPKMLGLVKAELHSNVKLILKRSYHTHFNHLTTSEILEKIKPLPIEE
jgi:protein required for attachment to host cells